MPQKEYSQIAVREGTQKELLRCKMLKQAERGATITWDEFLLDAVWRANEYERGGKGK